MPRLITGFITKNIHRSTLLVIIATLLFFNQGTAVQAACTIQGRAYVDYNENGVQNGREPGIGGIVVTAYFDANGDGISEAVGTATTLNSPDPAQVGTYTLPITAPDGQVRLEFTGLPDALFSGRYGGGGNSATTVTFVDCTGNGLVAGVNLATSNPGQYCHTDNPDLSTSCYAIGDQFGAGAANQPTLILFPYNAGAVTGTVPFGAGSPYDQPPHPTIALAPQTGSTYGIAYQSTSDSFFAAAYVKRHTGLGPGAGGQPSTGGIYRVTRTGVVNLLVDLQANGLNTGVNPHPPTGAPNLDWLIDLNAFDAVGKSGLGDLDISEDASTLYAVNMNLRTLVSIPVANPAGAVNIALPNPGCNNGQHRPFGLGVKQGVVYIGGVCDAAAGTAADLDAYVLSYNPANGAFAVVFRFDLDYPRRCADAAPACGAGGYRSADWRPWITTWQQPPGGNVVVYPQPMLVDIEFDNDDMIIGLRDRTGDQTGNNARSTNAADAALYSGIAAGDILRACSNGAGGWALEQNGQCGAVTTAGSAGDFVGQGPGNPGGEYYFTDNNAITPYAQRHDEIVSGGMLQLPGALSVAMTAFDPVPNDGQLFDGGIVWLSNVDGSRTRNYRIVNGTAADTTFAGKTNGLGDLAAACGPAPLEIGNRVWEDLDRNGVQDPGEQPLGNVILQLYMDTDGNGVIDAADPQSLIGQTTTSAAGEYYFNETNVFNGAINGVPNTPRPNVNFADINGNGVREINEPTGILPNRIYEIRLDNPANYAGGPLTGYYNTTFDRVQFNDNNDDARDSDGRNPAQLLEVSDTNFPVKALTTGDYGDNNHTYDFGFSLQTITLTPPVTDTPRVGDYGFTVSKSVNPPFAAPGQTITWTINIFNPYNIPATNVVVSDTVPGYLEIIPPATHNSATGNVSINGQTVTFTQAVLNPGESVDVVVNTVLRGGAGDPIEITNNVVGECCGGFRTGTGARTLRVRRLPATGESPLDGLQVVILGGVAVLAVGLTVIMRRRRTNPR